MALSHFFLWLSNIPLYICTLSSFLDIKEIVLETREPDKEPVVQTLPADNIIMAIGATPHTKIVRTTSGLENDEHKYLITRDVPYGMTTRKGVFAGGDVVGRQATVVHAMQDAKKVAEGIAQYVDAVKLMQAINLTDWSVGFNQ